MADSIKKADHLFTYGEYCSWPEDERWEIINGIAYSMSPAPTTNHQAAAIHLASELFQYLKQKECQVFSAPFDVILPEDINNHEAEAKTVVQPDITVICDKTKLTKAGCKGTPDLIMEVLSPSTAKKDLNEKFTLYEKHGVKEYWIVDSAAEYIRIFVLDDAGKYDYGTLVPPADGEKEDVTAVSIVLPEFTINTTELFESI
ncbi:MAG: Uma2 family endonuclease [Spirochaetales bacterium]|nr:Uma2 family endonuclease [Spirochaetales bacterium]